MRSERSREVAPEPLGVSGSGCSMFVFISGASGHTDARPCKAPARPVKRVRPYPLILLLFSEFCVNHSIGKIPKATET